MINIIPKQWFRIIKMSSDDRMEEDLECQVCGAPAEERTIIFWRENRYGKIFSERRVDCCKNCLNLCRTYQYSKIDQLQHMCMDTLILDFILDSEGDPVKDLGYDPDDYIKFCRICDGKYGRILQNMFNKRLTFLTIIPQKSSIYAMRDRQKMRDFIDSKPKTTET